MFWFSLFIFFSHCVEFVCISLSSSFLFPSLLFFSISFFSFSAMDDGDDDLQRPSHPACFPINFSLDKKRIKEEEFGLVN